MAEIGARTMSFGIDGSFLTQLARERVYYDGEFGKALELLMSCVTDDEDNYESEAEREGICFAILNGRGELSGIAKATEDSTLGFHYTKKDKRYDLVDYFNRVQEELRQLKKERDVWTQKQIFLNDYLDINTQHDLNEKFIEEGFDGLIIPCCDRSEYIVDKSTGECKWNPLARDIADLIPSKDCRTEECHKSFEAMKIDTETHSTENYGWLEPNGEFHEVRFGEHSHWAMEYLQEKIGVMEALEKFDCDVCKAGDYLVEELGWILLENPTGGIAVPTRSDSKRVTKSQKDFLYGYYSERHMTAMANQVMEW